MNEKFSISIESPCSEKFRNFEPRNQGGYCNSCQKVVIDFTKMSDREILNYFDRQINKTCGVFLESQLKMYSDSQSLPKLKTNRFVSGIFGFSLFSLLSFNHGYSQEKSTGNETVKIEKEIEEQNMDSSDVNTKYQIKGIVSDEMGPLPGANVVLRGKQIGIQTDLDGTFTFPQRLQVGDILVISYLGLKDHEFTVIKESEEVKVNYDIKLSSNGDFPFVMMGEVNTTSVYKSKGNFFHKIKSLFTND